MTQSKVSFKQHQNQQITSTTTTIININDHDDMQTWRGAAGGGG